LHILLKTGKHTLHNSIILMLSFLSAINKEIEGLLGKKKT